jgi:hypothetical protein
LFSKDKHNGAFGVVRYFQIIFIFIWKLCSNFATAALLLQIPEYESLKPHTRFILQTKDGTRTISP